MTTLVPRPSYTQDELDRLYPKKLKLQLVQIVCPMNTGIAGYVLESIRIEPFVLTDLTSDT